ncbi:MAG: replicative DNA helicase [Chloroflexi bacterium]|nr:replicative DNA helicase [Chloroflexota bacterium]
MLSQNIVSIEKLPPQNIEAEMSILGACLIDRESTHLVTEILPDSEDFYRVAHQDIYSALLTLYEKGEGIDLITLSNELRRRGKLEEAGGLEYLQNLMDMVPAVGNVEYYSNIVRDKATLRKLIHAGVGIQSMGFRESEDVTDLLDKSESLVYNISQRRERQDFVAIKPILTSTFDRIEDLYNRKAHVTGIPTGYPDLDKLTAGFQRSNMIVLAARPGVGKTSLALNIARNVAVDEREPVALFSMEMSKEEIGERLLCSEARVNAMKARTGHLADSDWPKITRAMNALADIPFYVDDSGSMTVLEIRSKARRLKSKFGLSMVIVDYLQLIRGTTRTESRNQEISEISRQIKALAKELTIPVIAISQLSREVEKRTDKRPQLSDLRESGAIEQEADLVLFIYRPEMYERAAEEGEIPLTELLIAKQRNGPCGKIDLKFLNEYALFQSVDHRYED